MSLFNILVKSYFSKRIQSIQNFSENPFEYQDKVFKFLIQNASKTEFGKKYSISPSTTYQQFAENIPVSNYEQFFPYIEQVLKGEANILWPGKIKWFAKSSGTTNDRSKFIPISYQSLFNSNYKAGKDMMTLYIHNNENTKIFTGHGLVIGGSHQINSLNQKFKSIHGDISAIFIEKTPFWLSNFRTPSKKTALLSTWEDKVQKMIEECANKNVTNIIGVPTWTIVLIEKMLEAKKKENLTEIWSNLEVFFHGAVAFQPYQDYFNKLIPTPKMNYMESYNASEGFFAIQYQKKSNDLLLLLNHGIYYEFIPLENINDENPKTLKLNEVELNKVYALVISTSAGLWRYNIGDTIKFTSKSPYRIKIVGRTKLFINAFGEELMIENAECAISFACKKTNSIIENYTAAPLFLEKGKKGCHEWAIEFEREPDDIQLFTSLLDSKLKEVNSDYEAKRQNDLALSSPKIHYLSKGTFYIWMKKRDKLGGQNKVPRLSNDRKYLDEILSLKDI